MRNTLEYLEHTAARYPDKTAFSNGKESYSFSRLQDHARRIGTALAAYGRRRPVAVFLPKHPRTVCAFLGVLYSGNLYVPLDAEMGDTRMGLILGEIHAEPAVCDTATAEHLRRLGYAGRILLYDELVSGESDDALLADIRRDMIDTDPMYVVFTSGSTGVPKGVVANHRSVIDYIDRLAEVLQADEHTVFGNQAPLYLDACLKEVYTTLKCGATAYFIPKGLFSFPVRLMAFMEEHHINTVCWVVSALTILSGLNALTPQSLPELTTIAFGSEVFPPAQLKLWRGCRPNARFINLYGPTECTGMSTYYILPPDFPDDTPVPIGQPFANTQVFLLDDSGQPVTAPDTPGELYIRGTAVTPGYWNNPERTEECFVQNPLLSHYHDIVYRTGDLACYNARGELCYLSRKDDQIKHMGYRIELPEIEAAAARIPDVAAVCCVYDDAHGRIMLYYTGGAAAEELSAALSGVLPRYMVPGGIVKLDAIPKNSGGKSDRHLLREWARQGKDVSA